MDPERLLCVGIDVGTSTTSLVFSYLTMENRAGMFSVPAVEITEKEIVYQSPVYRTPLLDETRIDGKALRRIVEKEYRTAGVHASQVQSGAVIITGESARKENANIVLEELSQFAGDFVVATAGPDLESVIAGQGSGAQQYSKEHQVPVVNLDIGGGTTNIVLFDGEKVLSKGCLDIGGRHVIFDEQRRITYISPVAMHLIQNYHLPLYIGEPAPLEALRSLCEKMSSILEQQLENGKKVPLLDEIQTEGAEVFAIPEGTILQHVCFSGGVADCIYHSGTDLFAYGDIGVLLAETIRSGSMFQKYQVIRGNETIRATVIGAGSYTTTVSGSTIDYDKQLFPRKNISVLKLNAEEEQRCWQGDIQFVREKVKWFLQQNQVTELALALKGRKDPTYEELLSLAQALGEGLHRELPPESPVIILLNLDMAKALGQILKCRLPAQRKVLSLDGVFVEQNYFVDLGMPVMNGLAVPLVVKTLVFHLR